MKRITLLGATGMVGKNLLQKMINQGFQVKALARNKNKLQDFLHAIEVIEGDYFDNDKLERALAGSDVILSTIGPPLCGELLSDEEDRYINALAYLIKQMQTNKQTRWISISGAGVKRTHENLPLARKLLRVKLKAASKSTVTIKDRELQMLEQSPLDWTCIRPPMIEEGLDGYLVAHENKYLGSSVDLNQLSDFILAEITKNDWIKEAPVVGTKA